MNFKINDFPASPNSLPISVSGLLPTCEVDGLWKQTFVGTVAVRRNDTACSNSTSTMFGELVLLFIEECRGYIIHHYLCYIVTRLCGPGPKWNDPICITLDNALIIQPTISTITQVSAHGYILCSGQVYQFISMTSSVNTMLFLSLFLFYWFRSWCHLMRA